MPLKSNVEVRDRQSIYQSSDGVRCTPTAPYRIGLWGNAMASNLVNMDALIKREDYEFATKHDGEVGEFTRIFASDLVRGHSTFSLLRKPEFQRETAIWSPEQVAELINAFVMGDLVPAVILWRSPTNKNFIVDGAHRVSSLIAWVNNDYGTGEISKEFFDGAVSDWEKAALKTKELVENSFGPYKRIVDSQIGRAHV